MEKGSFFKWRDKIWYIADVKPLQVHDLYDIHAL